MAEAVTTCGNCGQPTGPKAVPRAPTGLGTDGRGLWRDVLGAYELDPQEVRILREAGRLLDEIRKVEAVLDAAPSLVTRGSQGQDVGHPLLAELRQHRAAYEKLMKALDLPDATGNSAPSDGQRRSATANAARWGQAGAKRTGQGVDGRFVRGA